MDPCISRDNIQQVLMPVIRKSTGDKRINRIFIWVAWILKETQPIDQMMATEEVEYARRSVFFVHLRT